MITERLFCVKRWEAGFWLQPGAAPHPDIHADRHNKYSGKGEVKNRVGCPFPQVAKRLEKIHAEVACQEGEWHEQHGDDGEGFYDLVHAVIDHRQVRVQDTAY